MTEKQLAALRHLGKGSNWIDPTQLGEQPYPAISGRVFGALVRLGLAQSRRNSEHIRHEPRVYWTEYKLTSAGREKLRRLGAKKGD